MHPVQAPTNLTSTQRTRHTDQKFPCHNRAR